MKLDSANKIMWVLLMFFFFFTLYALLSKWRMLHSEVSRRVSQGKPACGRVVLPTLNWVFPKWRGGGRMGVWRNQNSFLLALNKRDEPKTLCAWSLFSGKQPKLSFAVLEWCQRRISIFDPCTSVFQLPLQQNSTPIPSSQHTHTHTPTPTTHERPTHPCQRLPINRPFILVR